MRDPVVASFVAFMVLGVGAIIGTAVFKVAERVDLEDACHTAGGVVVDGACLDVERITLP